jgi:hypothetical protein
MIYVRMYGTQQQARDVVNKLKDEGFAENTILMVGSGSGGQAGSVESVSSAIAAGFIQGGDAEAYAQGVQRGRTLVLIRVGFGHGQAAVNVLESGGPVDTDLLPAARLSVEYDEAAPLSRAFQWPLLKRNQPAPFSAWLGYEAISPGSAPEESFGYPLLNNSATPLSSLLGLETLSYNKEPGEESFGFPLLSADPTPLSTKFGLPLLTSAR